MVLDRCIQHIRKIIISHEKESGPLLLSEELVPEWLKTNGEKIIRTSFINTGSLTLKTLLWNYENLKAPVRLNFKSQLMELLFDDKIVAPGSEAPDTDKQNPQADTVESESASDLECSMEETRSQTGKPSVCNTYQAKEDWFDRMLNVVAAVVRGFMLHGA